ncbi:hypothetical protein CTI12_AA104060 [Artemisia annua]|uniref:Uncharacterized protein n=1 Tax=Artemisia annua TaxID=35608 RepID=A0A2U1PWF7_ARTAN|nr:hypothetical protein CTI12_AA415150 [Artemisia annua]PWA90062.1 hypothetical protein CTI12_AA104060 [Artemisia annua]
MAESSNVAFANNVDKMKDKKGEVADPIAWYFEEKAKALLKKRMQWEVNEKRCMKERRKTTALRRKANQTRRKWEYLQQVGIEHDNSKVDHEDILETLDRHFTSGI